MPGRWHKITPPDIGTSEVTEPAEDDCDRAVVCTRAGAGVLIRAEVPASLSSTSALPPSGPSGLCHSSSLLDARKASRRYCAYPWYHNQALTMPKMTPISSHVRLCACCLPPSRARRIAPAIKNAHASTARMYLAATRGHPIFASNRCWRHAGALVLKSGVPGSSRHRWCAARVRCRW
jgi:hypothetical protein